MIPPRPKTRSVFSTAPVTGRVPEPLAVPPVEPPEGALWPMWRVKLMEAPSPVTTMVWSPVVRVVGVYDQLPEASAVVV